MDGKGHVMSAVQERWKFPSQERKFLVSVLTLTAVVAGREGVLSAA